MFSGESTMLWTFYQLWILSKSRKIIFCTTLTTNSLTILSCQIPNLEKINSEIQNFQTVNRPNQHKAKIRPGNKQKILSSVEIKSRSNSFVRRSWKRQTLEFSIPITTSADYFILLTSPCEQGAHEPICWTALVFCNVLVILQWTTLKPWSWIARLKCFSLIMKKVW